jgi:LEA14-like dessication related protein
MTRLINAVLIAAVSFFVFLGVFWQFAGGGTGAGARGEPSVTAVVPRWQPAGQQEIGVELTVHNPAGTTGRIAAVSYEALVNGDTVDHAVARVPAGGPVDVAAKADGLVRFGVDLPEGFATQWWTAYMHDAESSDLRIRGNVTLQREDGAHEAPFEWRSAWTGDLAKRLQNAVRNCEGATGLCLADSQFTWKDGALHARLTLHNPGPDTVAIRNTTLRLLFGDAAVVRGDVDLVRDLAPDDDAQVDLALGFSQAGIAAWWPDHVARCERTPLALGLDLQARSAAQGADGANATSEVTTLQWLFPASTFQTRFVCS